MSLSARRAWIEISGSVISGTIGVKSLSARRAWIEIECRHGRRCPHRVALRKESVDRNKDSADTIKQYAAVALRKESVDRN